MNRQNKKEEIATLHRKNILTAAGELFTEKGFLNTTIDDISKKSEYSRRTIYSYFKSKEEIMRQIVLKGLINLKTDIKKSVDEHEDFIQTYFSICDAMLEYKNKNPHSSDSVNNFKPEGFDFTSVSQTVKNILKTGDEINSILVDFLEYGKKQRAVIGSIDSKKTVFVIWSAINSLVDMTENKGDFITAEFGATKEDFLKYGFTQIINSIMEVRIKWKTES